MNTLHIYLCLRRDANQELYIHKFERIDWKGWEHPKKVVKEKKTKEKQRKNSWSNTWNKLKRKEDNISYVLL